MLTPRKIGLTSLFLAAGAALGSVGLITYQNVMQEINEKVCRAQAREQLKKIPVNYYGFAGYDAQSGKCTYTYRVDSGFSWITTWKPYSLE
jgi:hypothetical protein